MGSEHRKAPRTAWASHTITALGALACLLTVSAAHARPGTHAPAMSTWDTRASSVAFHTNLGFISNEGLFRNFSYNANFTSTSGNLSAQFGLHYLQLDRGKETRTEEVDHDDNPDTPDMLQDEEFDFNLQHGLAASATGVLSIPVLDRTDNGIPMLAIGVYLGAVPSVLTSGNLNDLTVPVALGLGIPYSPHKAITITPWGEAAFSLNADAEIKPFDIANPEQFIDDLDAVDSPDDVQLSETVVEDILSDSVDASLSFDVSFRGGLRIGVHMWDGADLDVGVTVGRVGDLMFTAASGALVWRWDDIVPAVLPAQKRLLDEPCDAVAERHLMCQTEAQADGEGSEDGTAPQSTDPNAAEETAPASDGSATDAATDGTAAEPAAPPAVDAFPEAAPAAPTEPAPATEPATEPTAEPATEQAPAATPAPEPAAEAAPAAPEATTPQ